MRKKTCKVIIVAMAIGVGIAFVIAMNAKRDLKTTSDYTKQLKADNKKLVAANKKLVQDNEDLEAEVEELTAVSREKDEKIAYQTGQIEGLETRIKRIEEQVEKDTKPKVLRFYNGKLTEVVFQDEMDAINHPVDIYEGITQRDIAFFISGIPVKNVYVNQQKLEDVTYNEQEKMYVVSYYMPGEGQYSFIVETENGNYYFSVNY